MALKYHPLKNNDNPNVLDKFNNLAEAYEILSDRMFQLIYLFIYLFLLNLEKRRAIFDQYGEQGLKYGVPMG